MARTCAAENVRIARPASRTSDAGPITMRETAASHAKRRAHSPDVVAPNA